jgi:hypothetical protein
MNCEKTAELLPWHLNGSLDAEETRQVAEHLETCADCREALAATRAAARIFSQHLPAEALVALAWGERPEIDLDLADEHLRTCPQCAADLELARTSRALEQEDGVALFTPRSKPAPAAQPARAPWRAAALAAGLAGLVAFGGWIYSAGQAHDLEARLARTPAPAASRPPAPSTADREQLAALEAKVKELSGQAEEMQKRLAAREQVAEAAPPPASPLANTWPVMMEPADVVRGSEPQESKEAKSGSGISLILHTLHADNRKARRVEIADASGRTLLSVDGLVPDPDYDSVSLSLPKGFLKPGSYTVRATVPGGPAETYALKVR